MFLYTVCALPIIVKRQKSLNPSFFKRALKVFNMIFLLGRGTYVYSCRAFHKTYSVKIFIEYLYLQESKKDPELRLAIRGNKRELFRDNTNWTVLQ